MSKEYCDYHAAKPAVWCCEECNIPLCTECVPGSRENYESDGPRCALCNKPLKYLGGANIAEPFWMHAGTFFRYPLKFQGLVTLAAIALATALLPPNLLGIIGLLFIAAFTIHYGLRIINRVRLGDMLPPDIRSVLSDSREHLFLKQIAVLLILSVFVAAGGQLGTLPGYLVGAFVILAIPASTMLLAITTSVIEAVHPGNLARLMWQIGPTYLLLWLCLMIVAAGPTLVTPLLIEILPQRAAFPVSMFVSSYFTFVTYAMMGYMLYEKQASLGFSSDDEFGEFLEYRPFMIRRALANARILAAAGRHQQALELLRGGVEIDQSNADLRELYYRIVLATDDEDAIVRNANSICDFFISHELPVKASNYCLETRKRYPAFAPADAKACHLIAEEFFDQGRHKDAAALLLKLHKTAPSYPEMVPALILMARIFFEGMDARDKAVALLQQVRTRHPDHPETARIDRLLEVMTYEGSAT